MEHKFKRYVLLPFVISLLITHFFREKLVFLQSDSELHAYFIYLTMINAGYIIVAGNFAQVITKALKLRRKKAWRLWWSFALFPFVFFFGINLLVSALQMHQQRIGPRAVLNGWVEDGVPCDRTANLRSPASTGQTAILFSNQSRFKVRVNWLDSSGRQRPYKELRPGEKYQQISVIGQLWSITDISGKCLAVYPTSSSLTQALVNDAIL